MGLGILERMKKVNGRGGWAIDLAGATAILVFGISCLNYVVLMVFGFK